MKIIDHCLLIVILSLTSFQIAHAHFWDNRGQLIHNGAFETGVDIEAQAVLLEYENKDVFVALMNLAKQCYKMALQLTEEDNPHTVYPDIYNTFIKAHEGDKDAQLKVSGLFRDGKNDDVKDNRTLELYWLSRSMQDDASNPYGFFVEKTSTSLFQLTARETSGLFTTVIGGMLVGATAGKFFDDAYNEGLFFYTLIGAGAGSICGLVAWFGGSKFVTWIGDWLHKRRKKSFADAVDAQCKDAKMLTEAEYKKALDEAKSNLRANIQRLQSGSNDDLFDEHSEHDVDDPHAIQLSRMEEGRVNEVEEATIIPKEIKRLMRGHNPKSNREAWDIILERSERLRATQSKNLISPRAGGLPSARYVPPHDDRHPQFMEEDDDNHLQQQQHHEIDEEEDEEEGEIDDGDRKKDIPASSGVSVVNLGDDQLEVVELDDDDEDENG